MPKSPIDAIKVTIKAFKLILLSLCIWFFYVWRVHKVYMWLALFVTLQSAHWRWYSKYFGNNSCVACSRYIQSSDWMSLPYHVVCSTEHSMVNFFPSDFDRFNFVTLVLQANKPKVIRSHIEYSASIQNVADILQWRIRIIITTTTIEAASMILNYFVCVRDFIIILVLYFGWIFTWLACTRHTFSMTLIRECYLWLLMIFTPFATCLDIWTLWVVALTLSCLCSYSFVMHSW